MKKRIKKAFTLVELLVVIAILAVLSTVTVIGYNSFTEKANKSVDEQLCTQYNTILQAESVLDDDITLPELIIMIEENGIRANKFDTKSKSYMFAYDKANSKTVLLDVDSGNIEFPKNYDASNAELWAVLNDDLKLSRNINNYVLLSSLSMNSTQSLVKNGFAGSAINLDLNNCALQLASEDNLAGIALTVKNGTVVKKDAGVNVTLGTNASIIDTTSATTAWGKVFPASSGNRNYNLADDEFTYDASTKKIVIKDKFFSYEGETTDYLNFVHSNYSAAAKGGTIVIENCVFENMALAINTNARIIVRNCKFYNATRSYYPLTVQHNGLGGVFSYEIVGNEFINTIRGINLYLPAANTEKSIVDGNKFTQYAVSTEQDERKDNAIQFGAAADNFAAGTYTKDDFGMLEIKNNKIFRGLALISIHETLAMHTDLNCDYNHTHDAAKCGYQCDYGAVIQANVSFSNNDYAAADHGMYTIDPGADATERVVLEGIAAIIEAKK